MGAKSAIEWTDATWNPISGCTRVSEGCRYCYAETLAARFSKTNHRYMGIAEMKGGSGKWTNEIKLHYDLLDRPIRWRKPRMIFVNSMSDLYHEKVPTEFIHEVFCVMNQASHHTYQILTKRDERLAELSGDLEWQPWIWQGVSIEDQETTARIAYLRETHASIKFLSIEPLIGRIHDIDLDGIDWVIVGGESGDKARHMSETWVRYLISICDEQEVPIFVKQMGTIWGRTYNADYKGQDITRWPQDLRIREYPKSIRSE